MPEGAALMDMSGEADDKRLYCPRCQSRGTVQSTAELRPGTHYLTLRCASCGQVYDAQVARPTAPATSWQLNPTAAWRRN